MVSHLCNKVEKMEKRFEELMKKFNEENGKRKTNESNRFEQALSLPVICNINPRSVYNKSEEFHTLVKEETIDVVFMSESWERDYLPLNQIIKLEDLVRI